MDTLLPVLLIVAVGIGFRVYRNRRKNTVSLEPVEISREVRLSLRSEGKTIPSGIRTVEVSRIEKAFGHKTVVEGVSFEVNSGEIFGMVGPNGAGKTTTIRMMLDIIKADSGLINVFDQPFEESTKERIGYLPEERGLYRKVSVSQSLDYLGRLKGLSSQETRQRTDHILRQLGMLAHKDKKVEQLSRGMSQLIQFAATTVHDPDLIILDEPFSGLDPVNKEVLKEMIGGLKAQGKTIILSAHQMNDVEELCDRILMINKGKVVLYGSLSDIRARFRNRSVFLETDDSIDAIDGVAEIKDHGKYVEVFLEELTSPQDVLNALLLRGITVNRFEISTPSLNEIFIKVAREQS